MTSRAGWVLGALGALGAGLVLARLQRRYLQVTVDGPSMLPALAPGDRVLARRVPATAVRAGDIVLVRRPAGDSWSAPGPGHWVVKRAVAVPGDPVPAASVAGAGAGTVPPGMFVLLGDNAADSTDSRMLGYCPGARIAGVVSGPAAFRAAFAAGAALVLLTLPACVLMMGATARLDRPSTAISAP